MPMTSQASFLNVEELEKIKFRSIGKNVLVSRKASIYSVSEISIGSNSRIDDFCVLVGGQGLTIGHHVHIGCYSAIFSGAGVIIEDFAGLSARVTLYSESDDYSGASLTNPTIPQIFKPGYRRGRIWIKRHCIVGVNSSIMPGVTLHEGAAIGGHSLVVSDCSEWSIYAGVPARRIKARTKELLNLEQQFCLNKII